MSFLSGIDKWLDSFHKEEVDVKLLVSGEVTLLRREIDENFKNVEVSLANLLDSKDEHLNKYKDSVSSGISNLSVQVAELNKRVIALEALIDLVPSKKSLEDTLNELDKKISAVMVSQSFPTYSSVPHDAADPMNLINSARVKFGK